jgi:biliverdin reductase
LLNQFKTPIILILIVVAVRSIFLQDAPDAIFWDTQAGLYKACLCNAQLRFANGFVPEAIYGKGETFWQLENIFTIYREEIAVVFTPEFGQLMQGENRRPIKVGTRRGLFALDTDMVLKYLSNCTHLYVKNDRSL